MKALLDAWTNVAKPVIGMLHLPALPGSPLYGGSIAPIREAMLRDAALLAEGGVNGLMIENFGDVPFYPGRVPAHVIAHITALAAEVRGAIPQLPLGINVLRNDGLSALSVAHAVGAHYVRVNVLCGARVADQGLLQGIAHDLLRLRAELKAESIRIFADVDVKHSAALAARAIVDEVDDTLHRGLADALIVSGAGTGKATDPEKVRVVKSAAGEAPVFLGSGVTPASLPKLLPHADGFIVGTYFKKDGVASKAVDPQRVHELMKLFESPRLRRPIVFRTIAFMKLAVSTYSLWRWRKENNKSMEQSLDWIKSSGVDGVEFAGTAAEEPKDLIKRAAALRKRCEKLGLKIVSYCVGAELLVPAQHQKAVVERLKKEVDAGEELGVPSMRHDVTRGFGDNAKGLRIAKTFDAAVKHIVPAIRAVSDYAQHKRIKTSLENHGFYMQESKRVEKLIKSVDHPNYGLTIDLGNFMCVNENPTDATKRLAKYVIMAHAKDFHVKPKSQMPAVGWFATPTEICLRGAIAGHGVLDLPAQLKLLRKAGYDGYLSLEFEGMEEPAKAITLGLDYLRPLLKSA